MAGAKHQIFLLFVVEQYPADRSEADDDSDRDRPGADADVADGLPHAFILGDLAIAHLGLFVRVVHRLPPIMNVDLARSALPFVN